ncbi:MAG: helix-turn-helix domain-containing protein [Pseudomonadota bacterium]
MALPPLAGARIRRQRLDRGLKQTELAKACGISPSYLNLIEHDRRPIGGKLIADLAVALGVSPEQLNAGAEGSDLARLRSAAGHMRNTATPELSRVDEFALRFPGWADLVAGQANRIQDLERRLEVMADRVSQDPALAASLHNILSTVTAIRSTAGILAGDDPVEPTWQARFHRNLYEESQRLAVATETLVADLEESADQSEGSDPVEAIEAWLEDGSVQAEVTRGDSAKAQVFDQINSALPGAEAKTKARDFVEEMLADEAELPAQKLRGAIANALPDPLALADRFAVRLPLMLRRLASLPELGAGFVRTDEEGELLYRRQIPGFSVPRYGAARQLWPLYAALRQPGRAEVHTLGPNSRPWERFRVFAVAETLANGDVQGAMLILPDMKAPAT